jgi:hypothetical protein
MGRATIEGQLIEQLNEALIAAFPTPHALRAMVRFECSENLDAIAPTGGDLEQVVFALVSRAEAYNWLEKLVRGARRRNPGNPALLDAATALGYEAPLAAAPVVSAVSDLPAPYKFDMNNQVNEIAGNLPSKGLAGYAVPDSSEGFLNHLRQRLHDELGRERTYCYPSTLRIDEVRQPPAVALRTITANARGRLATHDLVFFIAGWRSGAQAASFWTELETAVDEIEKPRALAVFFAFDAEPLPPELPPVVYRLPPPRFSKGDLNQWIRKLVTQLGWPPPAIDIWQETILSRVVLNNELVNIWVYDHLEFADSELRRSQSFDQWQAALQRWSDSYA